jgi:anthranilate/para-aminobenzoate synthase component I
MANIEPVKIQAETSIDKFEQQTRSIYTGSVLAMPPAKS